MDCLLAIDQGTTGTTSVLVDSSGRIITRAYREITQYYPQPGWVEHDPQEIWESVLETVLGVLSHEGEVRVCGLGITNQRETTLVWKRSTGEPLGKAIVWQCRRTADLCRELKPQEDLFRRKTGLPLDAYFSGTKLRWILDFWGEREDPQDLCFGTVDAWIIWNLTGGRVHATDFSNASRTLLFNIQNMRWDEELCGLLDIPLVMLPEVKNSIADFGEVVEPAEIRGVAIKGVAGDQQAALFGQTGFRAGSAKNTYGTGCFLILNTGREAVRSRKGLVTTLAVDETGGPSFALEGSVFIGGAALQWLRDEIGILAAARASEVSARNVKDNAGVYMVPAFVGLGAPHWDMEARGIITGLTRGVNRDHLIRAALESMAYQTRDVLSVMQEEAEVSIQRLAVDGGAAVNDFLMQFQADILDMPVSRPEIIESTSLGAAFLAGLGSGIWQDAEALRRLHRIEREFTPQMAPAVRQSLLSGWDLALRQARTR